jgi:3'(2'), 5'-bisphosphate nucleotidase
MNIKYFTAIQAAVKAGLKILEIYNNPNSDFEIERKSDDSPLTIADKVSHQVIVENLEKIGLPILSEEGKNIAYETRKKWNKFWLIDPIDGTKEFIKKNGEFTINIALIEDNKAVFGVIYVPVSGDLYWGIVGEGAYKVNVSKKPKSLDDLCKEAIKLPITNQRNIYKVVASRSFMNNDTKQFIEKLKEEHPNLEMVSKGSSLKICMVAEGEADIYPRFGPTMEWDTAAGNAIVCAAGKEVTLTNGTTLLYNKENLLNPYFIVK